MEREGAARGGPRPGGRSARVQAAVHRAVRELQDEVGRSEVTVPAIALRAGVTPSTIYRRWGTLQQLLSDVALERLRPDAEPPDTGSFAGDLRLWMEQYADEMASAPGRALIRDVLGGSEPTNACQCSAFTTGHLEQMRQRALSRGETAVDVATIMDQVFAPLMYRILFGAVSPSAEDAHRLVARALGEGSEAPSRGSP
jgi:AcrR family transcriptional regulator